MDYVQGILNGERLALARLLSQVENDTPSGRAALDGLFPHGGRAHLIGVTGSPGSGKSSLVNQLARYYRRPPAGAAPKKVAVVAVDPSSPFTGGAILGDRVRMQDLAGDPGVFIRSMATRGSLGGLARATAGLVQVFDAAGYEVILIETVGAGQAEVDIARLAHTTLVVEAPGMGDDIQAIKAGILEIADILVINKADRPGVENTERALRGMLQLAHPAPRKFQRHHVIDGREQIEPQAAQQMWIPSIQKTVAVQGEGIAELGEAIEKHRAHLEKSGQWVERERARLQNELEHLVIDELLAAWRKSPQAGKYTGIFERLAEREISPHQAAALLTQEEQA